MVSEIPEPRVGVDYFPSDLPGHWRQDPISLIPLALGAHWGECRPFVLQATNQFPLPAPPAMTSAAYTTAYNEVKNLGGDGINTPTQRTPEQTFIGTFWGYDGTPSLCAPTETLQPNHGSNCRPNQTSTDSIRPASCISECRDGGSRNDRVGIEILS